MQLLNEPVGVRLVPHIVCGPGGKTLEILCAILFNTSSPFQLLPSTTTTPCPSNLPQPSHSVPYTMALSPPTHMPWWRMNFLAPPISRGMTQEACPEKSSSHMVSAHSIPTPPAAPRQDARFNSRHPSLYIPALLLLHPLCCAPARRPPSTPIKLTALVCPCERGRYSSISSMMSICQVFVRGEWSPEPHVTFRHSVRIPINELLHTHLYIHTYIHT